MQKTVQDGVLQLGVVKVVAQALGEREHPLPYRQARKDVIDKMRRRLDEFNSSLAPFPIVNRQYPTRRISAQCRPAPLFRYAPQGLPPPQRQYQQQKQQQKQSQKQNRGSAVQLRVKSNVQLKFGGLLS